MGARSIIGVLYITETESYITVIKGKMLEKQIKILFPLNELCLLIENEAI